MEPQRLSLMIAHSPIGPPGTLWESGIRRQPGFPAPRDTACGFPAQGVGVRPCTFSATNIELSGNSKAPEPKNRRVFRQQSPMLRHLP